MAQNDCSLLQIEIIRGKNLHDAEILSKSDPYCQIVFENKVDANPFSQKTKTIDNNLNPEWNEKFYVLITDDVKFFDVKVYDKNMLRDTSLGYCRILRPSIEKRAQRNGGWIPLEKGKGGQLEVYCSEVSLNRITDVMAHRSNQLAAAAAHFNDKFALLDLRILSGKGLKSADLNGKSDPYAVVTWDSKANAYPNKLKTPVIAKSLNPNWNSVFHVLVDPKSASSFRVDVYDKDTTSDDSLGHVNVPLNEINLGSQEDYAILKGKGLLCIAHCLIPMAGLFN